jgi:hypothetical protein
MSEGHPGQPWPASTEGTLHRRQGHDGSTFTRDHILGDAGSLGRQGPEGETPLLKNAQNLHIPELSRDLHETWEMLLSTLLDTNEDVPRV